MDAARTPTYGDPEYNDTEHVRLRNEVARLNQIVDEREDELIRLRDTGGKAMAALSTGAYWLERARQNIGDAHMCGEIGFRIKLLLEARRLLAEALRRPTAVPSR